MRSCFIFCLILLYSQCQQPVSTNATSSDYQKTIESWQQTRIQNLTKAQSWTSLAGLFWLQEGENTFGSDTTNQLIFPAHAPAQIGEFFKQGDSISIQIKAGLTVHWKDSSITNIGMAPDVSGNPTILKYQSFIWSVIHRGEKYGVRLWDTLSPIRQNFSGIDRFPIDEDWCVEARFIKYDSTKVVPFKNALGMSLNQQIEGKLVFKKNGKEYTLEALDGGSDHLFVIIADETTGDETYGGGRYLDVPRGENSDKIRIDFNKTYNPPCVFTEYATCLLPPPQNRLNMSVEAGEKFAGHH